MPEHQVTVAVLTRDRVNFLRQALESILGQRGVDFEVLVLDNASNDSTADLIRSYHDPRLHHIRSETDIGLVRNWNRAIQLAGARSPFVSIFHDDDIMLPGFLSESFAALSAHPSAGMSMCLAHYVGLQLEPQEMQKPGDLKPGLNEGLSFLELAVDGRPLDISPPIFLFRSEVLLRAGPVDSPHCRGTIDMNLYFRVAAISDFVLIPKYLVKYRRHQESETGSINGSACGTFWYGTMAERVDAIGYLLASKRAECEKYRKWLAERLLQAHVHQSAAIHPCLPQMYHTWANRREMVCECLDRTLPAGEPFLLVDDEQLGLGNIYNGRKVVPFLERDGNYDGMPTDAEQAIGELERMRGLGVRWAAIAWPSFWWLDHYGDFRLHLERRSSCRVATPHVRIYELER